MRLYSFLIALILIVGVLSYSQQTKQATTSSTGTSSSTTKKPTSSKNKKKNTSTEWDYDTVLHGILSTYLFYTNGHNLYGASVRSSSEYWQITDDFPLDVKFVDFTQTGEIAFYVLQYADKQALYAQKLEEPENDDDEYRYGYTGKYHFELDYDHQKRKLLESRGKISIQVETEDRVLYIADSEDGSISRFDYSYYYTNEIERAWIKTEQTKGVKALTLKDNALFWISETSVFCGIVKADKKMTVENGKADGILTLSPGEDLNGIASYSLGDDPNENLIYVLKGQKEVYTINDKGCEGGKAQMILLRDGFENALSIAKNGDGVFVLQDDKVLDARTGQEVVSLVEVGIDGLMSLSSLGSLVTLGSFWVLSMILC